MSSAAFLVACHMCTYINNIVVLNSSCWQIKYDWLIDWLIVTFSGSTSFGKQTKAIDFDHPSPRRPPRDQILDSYVRPYTSKLERQIWRASVFTGVEVFWGRPYPSSKGGFQETLICIRRRSLDDSGCARMWAGARRTGRPRPRMLPRQQYNRSRRRSNGLLCYHRRQHKPMSCTGAVRRLLLPPIIPSRCCHHSADILAVNRRRTCRADGASRITSCPCQCLLSSFC